MKVVKQFMIYETTLDAFCSSAYKVVQSKGSFVLKEIPSNQGTYRKVPKISPGAYIFQSPFLRGLFFFLYSEGFIYGGKFEFQNRLG